MTKLLRCDLCNSLNATFDNDTTAKIPYFDEINSEVVIEELCRTCTEWLRDMVHAKRQELENAAR